MICRPSQVSRRVPGNIEVDDPSSMMIKDDDSIAEPKRGGKDHEHVDRGDVCQVVLQEAAPRGGGLFGSPRHVSPDGSLTHLDPELEQLAVSGGAPEWLCSTHLADQIANLG